MPQALRHKAWLKAGDKAEGARANRFGLSARSPHSQFSEGPGDGVRLVERDAQREAGHHHTPDHVVPLLPRSSTPVHQASTGGAKAPGGRGGAK